MRASFWGAGSLIVLDLDAGMGCREALVASTVAAIGSTVA